MKKRNDTRLIHIWPIGNANLVTQTKEIPLPNKFIAAYSGYFFYKTRHGVFAVESDTKVNTIRRFSM